MSTPGVPEGFTAHPDYDPDDPYSPGPTTVLGYDGEPGSTVSACLPVPGDPRWYQDVEVCTSACHHPVHALGVDRRRHLVDAETATAFHHEHISDPSALEQALAENHDRSKTMSQQPQPQQPEVDTAAVLAASLGHTYSEPQWRVVSPDALAPERFGKDHYSTLLYVESRVVDHKGLLEHDNMRCNAARHPILGSAGTRTSRMGGNDSRDYPTFLRRGAGDEKIAQPDHDDYDCLDDMVACGWLVVTMPEPDHAAGVFLDAVNKPVGLRGETPVRPGFYTGLDELVLGTRARWDLTEQGWQVAADLRQYRAEQKTISQFADARFGPQTRQVLAPADQPSPV